MANKMRIEPEHGNVGVVLVGNLNPRIFHPDWFVHNGLVGPREGEAAEIDVLHREITIFRMDWISVKVEPNRFIAETQQPPFIRLHDFVTRTFKEFLPHTPIGALGINRRVHFRVADANKRDEIGKRLAPHEAWGEWGPEIEGQTTEKRGGLRTLVMEQNDLGDRDHGYIRAKVEPSTEITENVGIYMEINDHYQLANPDKAVGCEQMVAKLEQRFEESIRRSEWIIDQIMAWNDEQNS